MNRIDTLTTLVELLPKSASATVQEINRSLLKIPDIANLVSPVSVIDHIPTFTAIRFQIIELEDGRELYRGKQFCSDNERAVRKNGLVKLWKAAGGRFTESIRIDDGVDSDVRTYSAKGIVQGIDGRHSEWHSTYELDLRPGSIAIQRAASAKQEAQMRATVGLVAEAKAQNRVIRNALGIPEKYLAGVWNRPFVVPVLSAVLDTNDPELRRIAGLQALGVLGDLYNLAANQSAARGLPPVAEPIAAIEAIDYETGEVLETNVDVDDLDILDVAGNVYVNDCPCGDRTPLDADEYEASIEKLGCPRSKSAGCWPHPQIFDLAKHSDIDDLAIPKRPGLTVRKLAGLMAKGSGS